MNKIKELRKTNHLTQSDLAEICSTTVSNISGWECNKWQPDNETLIKLADYFKVSIDYILGREEWTDEEKALGVGRRATYLSEDEWEWLELRSLIIEKHGEKYLNTLITMLKAITNKK